MQTRRRTLLAAAGWLGAMIGARAHGSRNEAGPAKKEQTDWGIGGEPKAVRRTIEVRMLDSMRFAPDSIDVRLDETVRFVAVNTGHLLHEFVIGTTDNNQAHAALMTKFPGMEHDEPYMAHVPPGERREIVWTFNRPGRFEFACLIAGHYSAGMSGSIEVHA